MLNIVYTSRFDEEMRELQPDDRLADDFIFGVDFVLARNPHVGARIGDSDIWCVARVDTRHERVLHVYYSFDSCRVYLISIKCFDCGTDDLLF